MSFSTVRTIDDNGNSVQVECHVGRGLPGFTVVGWSDGQVRELRERVRAAFLCQGLAWPQMRITVNLAPHSVPRRLTSRYDLAVAMAVAIASDQTRSSVPFVTPAELGLDGTVRQTFAHSLADVCGHVAEGVEA